MVAIKNVLLFVTAATALTIGRQTAATIEKDISNIYSDVKTLTTATNNYNGGLINAIPSKQSSQSFFPIGRCHNACA